MILNTFTNVKNKFTLYYRIYIQCLIYFAVIYNNTINIYIITIVTIIILIALYFIKYYNTEHESLCNLISFNFLYKSELLLRTEYSIIILYIMTAGLLLIMTGDLIYIFISIELQSHGLYIIYRLYKGSESATSNGLTYFLFGGLSSCSLLLGFTLLYVNLGTTSLDNIYIMTSISELGYYYPYYLNLALILILVGFLFKISAVLFNFWWPYVYNGMIAISNNIFNEKSLISFLLYIILLLKLSCGKFILSNFSNTNIFEIIYLLGCFIIGLSVFSIIVFNRTNKLPNKINILYFFIKSVIISSFVLFSRDQFFGLSIDLMKHMPEVFIILSVFNSLYIIPTPSILPDQSGESSSNPSSSNKNAMGYGVSYLEGKDDSKCYPTGDGTDMQSYTSFLGYGDDPSRTNDSMIPLPPKLCKIPILQLLTPREVSATENYWVRQLYVANKLTDGIGSNIEMDHRITMAILDAQKRAPLSAKQTDDVLNSVRRIREGCNYLDLWDGYKNCAVHNLKQTDFGYLTKMEVDKDYTPLIQKSQTLVGHLKVEE